LLIGLGVSAILVVIEFAPMVLPQRMVRLTGGDIKLVDKIKEALILMAAMSPALAAFFTLWVELRAYEAQADNYRLMGRIFLRARRAAEKAPDDETFKAVVRDLGREALAENAEWLVDHRRRKIEQKA
jgi:hypothetical protein